MTKVIRNEYEIVLSEKNGEIKNNEIIELTTVIDEQKIGYCKYGSGKYIMLFICGGVGKFQQFFVNRKELKWNKLKKSVRKKTLSKKC